RLGPVLTSRLTLQRRICLCALSCLLICATVILGRGAMTALASGPMPGSGTGSLIATMTAGGGGGLGYPLPGTACNGISYSLWAFMPSMTLVDQYGHAYSGSAY